VENSTLEIINRLNTHIDSPSLCSTANLPLRQLCFSDLTVFQSTLDMIIHHRLHAFEEACSDTYCELVLSLRRMQEPYWSPELSRELALLPCPSTALQTALGYLLATKQPWIQYGKKHIPFAATKHAITIHTYFQAFSLSGITAGAWVLAANSAPTYDAYLLL
jgi:hypothetical protein